MITEGSARWHKAQCSSDYELTKSLSLPPQNKKKRKGTIECKESLYKGKNCKRKNTSAFSIIASKNSNKNSNSKSNTKRGRPKMSPEKQVTFNQCWKVRFSPFSLLSFKNFYFNTPEDILIPSSHPSFFFFLP